MERVSESPVTPASRYVGSSTGGHVLLGFPRPWVFGLDDEQAGRILHVDNFDIS